MKMKKYLTIEEYMADLTPEARSGMEELGRIISKNAPGYKQVISYNMPAFKAKKILVYYAAFKSHIGFYPANATIIKEMQEELKAYKTSKGTIQLPLDKSIPEALISKIVLRRMAENGE